MICTRLEGGLGNQLFQYAAGRALALRHGTELLLDSSALFKRSKKVTPRSFELHHFRHAGQLASPEQSRWLPWSHRVPALVRCISPWRPYIEKGLDFNEAFATIPDQSYLVGYWQSFRYFSGIADVLARELEPTQPLSPRSVAMAQRVAMAGLGSVALHVRRGDYVSLSSAASYHGTLPISYYVNALTQLRELVPQRQLFIFSDDVAWCREQLPLDSENVEFIDHNTGQDAWQDLVLMSHCRHHVIANSSFSWWGAWWADQRWPKETRLVYAPACWFAGHAQQSAESRFPSHWRVQP